MLIMAHTASIYEEAGATRLRRHARRLWELRKLTVVAINIATLLLHSNKKSSLLSMSFWMENDQGKGNKGGINS